MNDDVVLCEIKWTVSDVKKAFVNKYGRNPTDEELKLCIDSIDFKNLEDRSIEFGWDFINPEINWLLLWRNQNDW